MYYSNIKQYEYWQKTVHLYIYEIINHIYAKGTHFDTEHVI